MAISVNALLRNEEDDHEHHHEEEEGMSEVVLAKIVAMVVLFSASMLCGLLPMVIARKFKWIKDDQTAADIKSSNRIVLILLSFGGGVLLCTTFLHLIPEIGENVRTLEESGEIAKLPFHLDAFLTCAGFFAMYFVEESVHYYLHRRAHRLSHTPPDTALVRSLSIRRSTHNNNCHTEFAKDTEKQIQNVMTIEQKQMANNNNNHHHHHSHSHSHMPVANLDDDPVVSSLRGLLIVLALSVHELFEGLAVGLESSAGNVWYMFGAVSAHKLVIAFCVGVELLTSRIRPLLSFIYILTFAVVSPLGIGIGIGLSGGAGAAASGLPSVILQGLASGTLLYVVFFEILQRDRSGFIQLISSLVGFLVMFGLQFITGHSHSHSHGGGEDTEHHDHHH